MQHVFGEVRRSADANVALTNRREGGIIISEKEGFWAVWADANLSDNLKVTKKNMRFHFCLDDLWDFHMVYKKKNFLTTDLLY